MSKEMQAFLLQKLRKLETPQLKLRLLNYKNL
jgi:hypothetical protein